MEGFSAKRVTASDKLERSLKYLNEILGLKSGKFGDMIHWSHEYGGARLVGYSDFESSGITELGNLDRMSDNKLEEVVSTMYDVIFYAKKLKGEEIEQGDY